MKLHKTYYIRDLPNIAFFNYAEERWADFFVTSPAYLDDADYRYEEDNTDKFEIIPL